MESWKYMSSITEDAHVMTVMIIGAKEMVLLSKTARVLYLQSKDQH